MNNYDLIIIGAGPAALTASVYASRYKINHLVIGQAPGGMMMQAHKICNWPGEKEISGFDLTVKMKEHALSYDVNIIESKVSQIKKTETGFVVTVGDVEYNALSILLATGTIHHNLGITNEGKYLGHGLSYCATCDAMFFRNKVVAVIGGGNSALTAAIHLGEIASKVYLIVRKDNFRGEPTWIEQAEKNPKIEIIFNANVVEMMGEAKLEAIKLDKEYNGSEQVAVDGLFVEIGSSPQTEFFDALQIDIDPEKYITVNPDQATNIPGVYAAGDITGGSNRIHQIVTAASEGAIAASSIFKYLKKIKA
ncbi:MAG: FAD-dependent oxidoreductase [Candidatus Falkowbacteria bacterium]